MPDLMFLVSMLESSIRISIPLMLAALGGMFSERAGIVDFSLEGKLLGGAFAAAVVAALTGSAWAGLMAGAAAGGMLALLHGYATITGKGDQTISCVGINFIVAGASATVAMSLFAAGGRTPLLGADARLPSLGRLLGVDAAGVPVLANLMAMNVVIYLTVLIFVAVVWLFRTRLGLFIVAAGENPHALHAAGIGVAAVRYRALLLGGLICGVGGAYLSIGQNGQFTPMMSAGKGFIALAVLIFAKWRPLPIVLASLAFGALDALEARLQGVALPVVGVLPVQFVQALPFLITVLVLAGLVGGARAPAAIGKPFDR